MPEAQIFLGAFAPLSGSLINHSALLVLHKKKSYYLWYPFWGDKAGGLDHRQAGSWKHVYQLDFHPCRNNFLGNNETETALSELDAPQDADIYNDIRTWGSDWHVRYNSFQNLPDEFCCRPNSLHFLNMHNLFFHKGKQNNICTEGGVQ